MQRAVLAMLAKDPRTLRLRVRLHHRRLSGAPGGACPTS